MKLTKVQYELYESDFLALEHVNWEEPHEIDGQVRLEFADCDPLFISWSDEFFSFHPLYKGESFFRVKLEKTCDLSNSKVWRSLIGKEIDICFLNQSDYNIAIRSSNDRVLCWSNISDSLFVGRELKHVAT